MASLHQPCRAPGDASQNNPGTPILSALSRTVVLYDWWLVNMEVVCEGKRLAVGGFTNKGSGASRLFTSAPIVSRHDAYTLETADGITVMIKGIINQRRTEENGFPSEACRNFLVGFPYTWNSCANKYFGRASTCTNMGGSASSCIPGRNRCAFPNPTDKPSFIDEASTDKMGYPSSIKLEECDREEQEANISSEESIPDIKGKFHEKLPSAVESAQENDRANQANAQMVDVIDGKYEGKLIEQDSLGIPNRKISSANNGFQSIVDGACVGGRKPSNCIIDGDGKFVSMETEVTRNQVTASPTICDLDKCKATLTGNGGLLGTNAGQSTSHVRGRGRVRERGRVTCLNPRRSPRLNAKIV